MSHSFSDFQAAEILFVLLSSPDFFHLPRQTQIFANYDRVQEPDGVYAIEAERTVGPIWGPGKVYFWGKEAREAFALFAKATPDERDELFNAVQLVRLKRKLLLKPSTYAKFAEAEKRAVLIYSRAA